MSLSGPASAFGITSRNMFVEYLTPHIGTEPNQGSYVYAAVPASYAVVSIGITPGPGYGVTGLYPGLIADEYLWPAKGGTTSPFIMTNSTLWAEISVSLTP